MDSRAGFIDQHFDSFCFTRSGVLNRAGTSTSDWTGTTPFYKGVERVEWLKNVRVRILKRVEERKGQQRERERVKIKMEVPFSIFLTADKHWRPPLYDRKGGAAIQNERRHE